MEIFIGLLSLLPPFSIIISVFKYKLSVALIRCSENHPKVHFSSVASYITVDKPRIYVWVTHVLSGYGKKFNQYITVPA
jgi:hypothetical protein